MRLSDEGANFIKGFEQCRLKAYRVNERDPWTLGWGHTLGVQEGDECSQEQADLWFEQDVREFEAKVEELVTVEINQHQFDALVSFCYNCGPENLHTSTLLKKLNAGDIEGAALEFDKWNKAKGVVLAGLTRRRDAEEQEFKES